MKIALLGAGKTGLKVKEIHPDTIVFNTKNPPSLVGLKECDIAISFLPGDAFVSYLDLLVEAKIPVVTGSTGFNWPENFDMRLKDAGIAWIRAHNFSLGMNIVKEMILSMSYLGDLFEDGSYSIHDIHHVKKVDSPSGTAISWRDWLGKSAEITAERKGDVVGYHSLVFDSKDEKITLVHEAKERTIFARGAVWAAKILFKARGQNQQDLASGLHDFNKVVKDVVFK